MAARSESVELEVSNADTPHLLNRMAGLKEFAAKCIAASSGNDDFVPGRVPAAKPRDVGAGRALQTGDLVKGEKRFEFQVIRLGQMVRTQDTIRELAVVCQEDQTGSMVLEPSDRKDALGDPLKEIAQRTPAFGIAHGRNDFRWFVEEQVDAFAFLTKKLAGHLDVVARPIGLRAKLGDDATVDRYKPRGDKLLRSPPRSCSSACDNLL